jgi:hypothetical protein
VLNNPILISGGLPANSDSFGRLADGPSYAPREAPIMRGVAAERSDQRERLAAGGPQGSPDPTLLTAEARQFSLQRFSFQVYLASLSSAATLSAFDTQ